MKSFYTYLTELFETPNIYKNIDSFTYKVKVADEIEIDPIVEDKIYSHQEIIQFMNNLKNEMIKKEGSLDGLCYDACIQMKKDFLK